MSPEMFTGPGSVQYRFRVRMVVGVTSWLAFSPGSRENPYSVWHRAPVGNIASSKCTTTGAANRKQI